MTAARAIGRDRGDRWPRRATRLPLLALAFVALVAGIVAGLARAGIGLPGLRAELIAWHAVLMVCGFFGTLISLERAVAAARPLAWAAPLLAIGGSAALLLAAAPVAAGVSYCAAALMLTQVSAAMWTRQRALHTLTLAIAAGAWLAGNAVWVATWSLAAATPWWAAFLVLTIAGERLELTRLRPASPRARRAFVLLIAGWLAAPAALTAAALGALPVPPESGWRALGAIAVATAAWGLTNDIARHTIRGQGLTRYIAVCLLSGYGWLAASGAIWLTASHPGAGLSADAALHALMLGFVFSMVFAHAPVILPAVTTVPIVFHRGLYLPLAGLHLSLTVRIGGGVAGDAALRAAGAAANAVTVALFVAAVAAGVALARSASASSRR